MDLNKRRTDGADYVERVVALEVNVDNVKDAVLTLADDLRTHIADEQSSIEMVNVAIERLATTAEQHSTTMAKMATSLEAIAAHNARVSVLEATSAVTENRLTGLDGRVDEVEDDVIGLKLERSFLVKAVVVISTLIGAGWSVFTFFYRG